MEARNSEDDSSKDLPSNSNMQEDSAHREPLSPPQQNDPAAVESPTAESPSALEQAETAIEVREYEDSDPGYATDSDAVSVSLASSARAFIYENGRRYHSYREGSYSFPNDDREQDREDLKHAMFLKLFNGTLHFAPIGNEPLYVMDVGTGTGIWVIEMADLYPSATVLGIDLSPIQPLWVPPNCKFMVDDAESEWIHPPNHFDYVHTRHTVQGFRDWPRLMEQAYRHLKPGGWLECQELDHYPVSHDGSMAPDNAMAQYWGYVSAGLANVGVDFRIAPRLANVMRDAGFVNVTERVFSVPIGVWPKNRALREVGLYWREVLLEGLEAIALGPLTRGLGWQKLEIDILNAHVRKAYYDPNNHASMPFFIIYGQKPPNATGVDQAE